MHRPEYYAVLKHSYEIGVAVMTTSGREMLHIQPVTAKWFPGANLAAIPEELDLVRFAFHDRTPPVRCNMLSAGFERQRDLKFKRTRPDHDMLLLLYFYENFPIYMY